MYPAKNILIDDTFIGVDLHPFITNDGNTKMTQKQEDEQMLRKLDEIFDPATHDYKRVSILEKLGGVSKVMQVFGSTDDYGMQQYELEESRSKYGRNDSLIWNIISCSLLTSSIKSNLKLQLPLGFLVVTLMVKWWIFGFWFLSALLYSTLYYLIIVCWCLSEEISIIATWIFKEFWYVGNKRMNKKTYTVIRDGIVLRGISKKRLLCGDIIIINQDNPYVPEDCVIINKDSDIELNSCSIIQVNELFSSSEDVSKVFSVKFYPILLRFSQIISFGGLNSVYAMVCSTSKSRLERIITKRNENKVSNNTSIVNFSSKEEFETLQINDSNHDAKMSLINHLLFTLNQFVVAIAATLLLNILL